MARNFNTNTDNHDEGLTPPYIIESLGRFDLDPCAPINRPWDTARKHYSLDDGDGLVLPWRGRVWCNPPYGRNTFLWLEKLARHGSGIALIFARTETLGFHEQVWDKAHSVMFFKRRLKFHTVDGSLRDTANAPSCLVSYSVKDSGFIAAALAAKNLDGKQVFLR